MFHKDADYAAFLKLLVQASERLPMRLLGYCLMPNHFHLVVWPFHDGDLSRWMQWLLTSHVRRYHRHYDSSGHVWQGRFKAFPIQQDDHFLKALLSNAHGRHLGCQVPFPFLRSARVAAD